jgi:hypothetical protein
MAGVSVGRAGQSYSAAIALMAQADAIEITMTVAAMTMPGLSHGAFALRYS